MLVLLYLLPEVMTNSGRVSEPPGACAGTAGALATAGAGHLVSVHLGDGTFHICPYLMLWADPHFCLVVKNGLICILQVNAITRRDFSSMPSVLCPPP